MTGTDIAVLIEPNGKVHTVDMVDESVKIKGIGVLNPHQRLGDVEIGQEIQIGSKMFTRLPPRLPELVKGMRRRAQTIGSKDAGVLIARLGIGPGDVVLEAGLGSAGQSMHLARVMGASGHLITVEPRQEHSDVGLENLSTLSQALPEFPTHSHIDGRIESSITDIEEISAHVDAILLDLPEHVSAIQAVAHLLKIGARLSCYCPVSSQLEQAWVACEEVGLEVEWAGEIIEREWGKASKGGVRPVNGPFGHTAFLLIAQKK
jgi:tRNA (adenine57-N1/adenine58-N1)-methyltransferase